MNKKSIELVKAGFANGQHPKAPLSEEELQAMIEDAADAYADFLTALGCDWENDPNSADTPMRVAKAYVRDLWAGRYSAAPDITSFPSDGYTGLIQESNIPITSMCSHHHQTILGKAHIAYIPGPEGHVVGLSKLNRIVEHFARRGSIQEQLTVAIHNAVSEAIGNNGGVGVMVTATHNCVQCRGVKHIGASMQTTQFSGAFKDDMSTRNEFYKNIEIAGR